MFPALLVVADAAYAIRGLQYVDAGRNKRWNALLRGGSESRLDSFTYSYNRNKHVGRKLTR